MGATALSPAPDRDLQDVWRLHPAFGLGDSYHQQPVFSADRSCYLGNRSALFQPERRPVGGLDLGAVPGSDAICRPLGLGYVAHYLPVLLDTCGGSTHARSQNPRALGTVWAALGPDRPQQSGAPDLPAGVRAVGAGPSAPARSRRGAARGCAVRRLLRTLDLEKLGSLPPFRAYAGQLWGRAVSGQRTRIDRIADGIRPPYPGA